MKRRVSEPLDIESLNRVDCITPFIQSLWSLLSSKVECISWSESGTKIIISDPDSLSTKLLEHFKSGNFSSFVRQLNFYGFKKVSYIRDSSRWEFYHENFQKNRPELLHTIHRKTSTDYTTKTQALVIKRLQQENTTLKMKLSTALRLLESTNNTIDRSRPFGYDNINDCNNTRSRVGKSQYSPVAPDELGQGVSFSSSLSVLINSQILAYPETDDTSSVMIMDYSDDGRSVITDEVCHVTETSSFDIEDYSMRIRENDGAVQYLDSSKLAIISERVAILQSFRRNIESMSGARAHKFAALLITRYLCTINSQSCQNKISRIFEYDQSFMDMSSPENYKSRFLGLYTYIIRRGLPIQVLISLLEALEMFPRLHSIISCMTALNSLEDLNMKAIELSFLSDSINAKSIMTHSQVRLLETLQSRFDNEPFLMSLTATEMNSPFECVSSFTTCTERYISKTYVENFAAGGKIDPLCVILIIQLSQKNKSLGSLFGSDGTEAIKSFIDSV